VDDADRTTVDDEAPVDGAVVDDVRRCCDRHRRMDCDETC
jgi:hypothetical protein